MSRGKNSLLRSVGARLNAAVMLCGMLSFTLLLTLPPATSYASTFRSIDSVDPVESSDKPVNLRNSHMRKPGKRGTVSENAPIQLACSVDGCDLTVLRAASDTTGFFCPAAGCLANGLRAPPRC
jgi:hypothetical protein